MACTIARTAGKLATFPSRAATVTADPKVFELHIDPDPRLAAGAGGVARYLSEASGLDSKAVFALQDSVVAACLEAFRRLAGAHPHLTVTTTRFPDRIEVALAYQIAPSATISSEQGRMSGATGDKPSLHGVDRVQREARDGLAVTRLTKYLGSAPPHE